MSRSPVHDAPWSLGLVLLVFLAAQVAGGGTLLLLEHLPFITLHPLLWQLSTLRGAVSSFISAATTLCLGACLLRWRHSWHLGEHLRSSRADWRDGALLGLCIGALQGAVFVFLSPEVASDWGPADAPIRHPAVLAAVKANTILLVPLAEELLYRAMLYPVARRHFAPWPAIVVCSVAFTLPHGLGSQTPLVVAYAVAVCYLYDRRRSLALCVAAHSGFNLATFLVQLLVYPPWP